MSEHLYSNWPTEDSPKYGEYQQLVSIDGNLSIWAARTFRPSMIYDDPNAVIGVLDMTDSGYPNYQSVFYGGGGWMDVVWEFSALQLFSYTQHPLSFYDLDLGEIGDSVKAGGDSAEMIAFDMDSPFGCRIPMSGQQLMVSIISLQSLFRLHNFGTQRDALCQQNILPSGVFAW